jgi:hypothetical protein
MDIVSLISRSSSAFSQPHSRSPTGIDDHQPSGRGTDHCGLAVDSFPDTSTKQQLKDLT